MFFEEQTESFFGTELGNTSEVLHAEAIKNLGSPELAFAQTQWAVDGVGRNC